MDGLGDKVSGNKHGSSMNQQVFQKIQQRRLQLLVHSCIYYEMNTNIVSDAQWSRWAKELIQLQQEYPQEAAEVGKYTDTYSFEVFKDFDGSTGMDLPVKDPWVVGKATQLLNYKQGTKEQITQVKVKKRRLF